MDYLSRRDGITGSGSVEVEEEDSQSQGEDSMGAFAGFEDERGPRTNQRRQYLEAGKGKKPDSPLAPSGRKLALQMP